MPIAHIHEDIDAANATVTQQQLADALGPDASSLIIDLSETRYLDSAGIDMLLRLSDRLDHRRAKLILVIPDTSQLKRLAQSLVCPMRSPSTQASQRHGKGPPKRPPGQAAAHPASGRTTSA